MTYTTGDEPGAEHAPELDATEARQGRWGRHMLWVLLAGLILVAIALFGTWAMRAGDLQALDERAAATAAEGPATTSRLAPIKNKPQYAPSEQPAPPEQRTPSGDIPAQLPAEGQ